MPTDEGALRRMLRTVGGGLSTVGAILDYPFSLVRDVATGEPFWDQRPWNWHDRQTMRETVRKVAPGLISKEDNWKNFLGTELGLGILFDPLTWMTGGAAAYMRGAGTAGKAAGLAGAPAKLAAAARFGRHPKDVGGALARLVTPREAIAAMPLSDQGRLLTAFQTAAKAKKMDWTKLMDKPMGKPFSMGLPFGPGLIGVGGERTAKVVDWPFRMIGRVPPFPQLARTFDASRAGAKTPEYAATAPILFWEKELGRSIGREQWAEIQQTLERALGKEFGDPEKARQAMELIKGSPLLPEAGAGTVQRRALFRQHAAQGHIPQWAQGQLPGVAATQDPARQALAKYHRAMRTTRAHLDELGVHLPRWSGHKVTGYPRGAGGRYTSRILTPGLEGTDEVGTTIAASVQHQSMEMRKDPLRGIPGGTTQIQRIVRDPEVDRLIEGGVGTKAELDRYITSRYGWDMPEHFTPKVNQQGVVTGLEATERGKKFLNWVAELPKDWRETGIWGNHPAADSLRWFVRTHQTAALANIFPDIMKQPGMMIHKPVNYIYGEFGRNIKPRNKVELASGQIGRVVGDIRRIDTLTGVPHPQGTRVADVNVLDPLTGKPTIQRNVPIQEMRRAKVPDTPLRGTEDTVALWGKGEARIGSLFNKLKFKGLTKEGGQLVHMAKRVFPDQPLDYRLIDELKGARVPKNIAKDITRQMKAGRAPDPFGETFLRPMDPATNFWKAMQTAWPGFTGRNVLSGTLRNILTGQFGGWRAGKDWMDTHRLLRGEPIPDISNYPTVRQALKEEGHIPWFGPERERVYRQATSVFGQQEAVPTIALMDAHAALWARKTGKRADEWYKRISEIRRGTPADVAPGGYMGQPVIPVRTAQLLSEVSQGKHAPGDIIANALFELPEKHAALEIREIMKRIAPRVKEEISQSGMSTEAKNLLNLHMDLELWRQVPEVRPKELTGKVDFPYDWIEDVLQRELQAGRLSYDLRNKIRDFSSVNISNITRGEHLGAQGDLLSGAMLVSRLDDKSARELAGEMAERANVPTEFGSQVKAEAIQADFYEDLGLHKLADSIRYGHPVTTFYQGQPDEFQKLLDNLRGKGGKEAAESLGGQRLSTEEAVTTTIREGMSEEEQWKYFSRAVELNAKALAQDLRDDYRELAEYLDQFTFQKGDKPPIYTGRVLEQYFDLKDRAQLVGHEWTRRYEEATDILSASGEQYDATKLLVNSRQDTFKQLGKELADDLEQRAMRLTEGPDWRPTEMMPEDFYETLYQGSARDQGIPLTIARNLTQTELKGLRRDTAKNIAKIYSELPPDIEFTEAIAAGVAKKGWYRKANEALAEMFGEDVGQFVGVLAATSPRQGVTENLKMSLRIWNAWEKAGRPTNTNSIRAIIRRIPGADMPSRRGNVIRALKSQGTPDLSGFKVNAFARNLLGDFEAVTNDAWIAAFAGIDPKLLGTKSGYLAMNAKIRRAAEKVGIEPAEAQEQIWAFAKTVSALRKGGRTGREALKGMTHESVSAMPDFAKLIVEDADVKAEFARLGLGDVVERIARDQAEQTTAYTGRIQAAHPRVLARTTDRIPETAGGRGAPGAYEASLLEQTQRGAVQFAQDGKAVITAFQNADMSTFAHETGHIFRRSLREVDDDLLQKAEQALGVPNRDWSANGGAFEEAFASGFERYLAEGKAPSPALKQVFERFKEWLARIYHAIVGTPLQNQINPQLKEVFDAMLKDTRYSPQQLDRLGTDLFARKLYGGEVVGKYQAEVGSVLGKPAVKGISLQDIKAEIPGQIPYKALPRRGEISLNPKEVRGVGGRTESRFLPAALADKVNFYAEAMNRVPPMLTKMRQGVSFPQAIKEVGEAQVRYPGRFYTPTELGIFNRLAPFYKFARSNIPFVARELSSRPGGPMAQLVKGFSRGQQPSPFVPEHVRETMAIPMKPGRTGTRRYLAGFGAMFEDPLSFAGFLRGDVQGTLMEIVSRAHPLAKWGLEVAFDESAFQRGVAGGRPLGDMDPVSGRLVANIATTAQMLGERGGLGKVIRGEGEGPRRVEPLLGKTIEAGLSNIIGRPLTEIRRGFDPRKSLLTKALQFFTGARIQDISPAAEESIQREAVNQAMREMGGTDWVNTFIPEDVRAAMPLEKQQTVAALELQRRNLGEAAKQRRKLIMNLAESAKRPRKFLMQTAG